MKELYLLFCFFSILFLFSSCKKVNKDLVPPDIEFVKDSGFVFSDTLITPGSSIRIGVKGSMKEKNIRIASNQIDISVIL